MIVSVVRIKAAKIKWRFVIIVNEQQTLKHKINK